MMDDAQRQLDGFLARYAPDVEMTARAALDKMRARLPGAVQLVYDNYNALVIGFGPNERASDAVFSVALYPRWVNLFFLHGAALSDPNHLLDGNGKTVRRILLADANVLDRDDVQALIAEALHRAPVPIDPQRRGRLMIKSVSEKQRPRRPAKQ